MAWSSITSPWCVNPAVLVERNADNGNQRVDTSRLGVVIEALDAEENGVRLRNVRTWLTA
jgi:hypothetical protein